jgi:prepilin peptidase CpaA
VIFHSSWLQHGFVLAVVALAACMDVRTLRVPNWITLPALLASLLLHYLQGGWASCLSALLAASIAGAIFAVFFVVGGMGGGDVKLIVAVSAALGLNSLPELLVFTSLCGGAMAIFVAVRHKQVRQTLLNVSSLAAHHQAVGLVPHPDLHIRNEHSLRIPYAVAIAGGVLLTLLGQRVQG